MLKQTLYRISSCIMALVLLCSTMSFTVSMHYCGDTLVDTAVLEKARTCGMQDLASDAMELMKGCCSTEEFSVDGQDVYPAPTFDLKFQQDLFIASFVLSYHALFIPQDKEVNFFFDGPPPFSVRHRYKLNESYLI